MGSSTSTQAITVVADPEEALSRRVLPWIAILALVFLLHTATFLMRVHLSSPAIPQRMPIQTVDPRKLEEIRKQWDKRAKSLLLDKDKNAPKDKEAPKDAKYFSDRNIRVEKEQRARDQTIIPKPGSQNATSPSQPQEAQPESPPEKQQAAPKPVPKLGDLGVPFKLDKPAPKARAQNQTRQQPRPQQSASQRGGDQAISDKDIPEGSENLLNAQESVYYSFYARVYEAVGPIWGSYAEQVAMNQRLLPGDYVTQVDVVLDKNGNLLRVDPVHRSGVQGFDLAVDRAWQKINHFPNPPSDLLDQNGEIHTGWTFTVHLGSGAGGGFQLMPPERNY